MGRVFFFSYYYIIARDNIKIRSYALVHSINVSFFTWKYTLAIVSHTASLRGQNLGEAMIEFVAVTELYT